jgi:hypothetical protein
MWGILGGHDSLLGSGQPRRSRLQSLSRSHQGPAPPSSPSRAVRPMFARRSAPFAISQSGRPPEQRMEKLGHRQERRRERGADPASRRVTTDALRHTASSGCTSRRATWFWSSPGLAAGVSLVKVNPPPRSLPRPCRSRSAGPHYRRIQRTGPPRPSQPSRPHLARAPATIARRRPPNPSRMVVRIVTAATASGTAAGSATAASSKNQTPSGKFIGTAGRYPHLSLPPAANVLFWRDQGHQ